jgi:hypothetical protein
MGKEIESGLVEFIQFVGPEVIEIWFFEPFGDAVWTQGNVKVRWARGPKKLLSKVRCVLKQLVENHVSTTGEGLGMVFRVCKITVRDKKIAMPTKEMMQEVVMDILKRLVFGPGHLFYGFRMAGDQPLEDGITPAREIFFRAWLEI